MKAYKYLLIGVLMLGSSVPTFAQNDNKAVIEQGTKVILAKGADYKDQVKQLYKDNKKILRCLLLLVKYSWLRWILLMQRLSPTMH